MKSRTTFGQRLPLIAGVITGIMVGFAISGAVYSGSVDKPTAVLEDEISAIQIELDMKNEELAKMREIVGRVRRNFGRKYQQAQSQNPPCSTPPATPPKVVIEEPVVREQRQPSSPSSSIVLPDAFVALDSAERSVILKTHECLQTADGHYMFVKTQKTTNWILSIPCMIDGRDSLLQIIFDQLQGDEKTYVDVQFPGGTPEKSSFIPLGFMGQVVAIDSLTDVSVLKTKDVDLKPDLLIVSSSCKAFWGLRAILDADYRPRVIVVHPTAKLGGQALAVPLQAQCTGNLDASAAAYHRLAECNGYKLTYCNPTGDECVMILGTELLGVRLPGMEPALAFDTTIKAELSTVSTCDEIVNHEHMVAATPPPITICPEGKKPAKSRTRSPFFLCLHEAGDMISDVFRRQGYWQDCAGLPNYVSLVKKIYNIEQATAVDIGGNIGSCALQVASEGTKMTAFEPLSRNYKRFESSIAINKYNHVNLVKMGAGSSPREAVIKMEVGQKGGANFGNSIITNGSAEETVHLFHGRKSKWYEETIHITTVDTHVKEHVHFMKLDCQGHEMEALLGATNLIKEYGIDVIRTEFDPPFIKASGHSASELLNFLTDNGFVVLKDGKVVNPETFASLETHYDRESRAGRPVPEIFAVNKKTIPDTYYSQFR